MKTLFLLVLLTRNDAGDIGASFVNLETLVQCQQKETMVKGVFSSAGIPVIESRCVASDLQFSEFGHASSSSVIRYFYLIRFHEDVVEIKSVPDWQSCMIGKRQAGGKGRSYCSSSVQSLKQ